MRRFTWFKYEHVSAVESAPDSLSEDTLTCKVGIKGAPQVATELHLKMHTVVHLLTQKSSQNNSKKGKFEEALYVLLEGEQKISLWRAHQEKDAFDAAVDGLLDDAIKGTPLNLFARSLYLI